jgi:hypothetical protein
MRRIAVDNPYTLRPVTGDDYFIAARGGRGALAHRLLQNLRRRTPLPDCFSLVGERRFGKTSLIGFLQRSLATAPDVITASIDMLNLEPRNAAGFYAMLTDELVDAGVLPPDRHLQNAHDLRKVLSELHKGAHRLVLFIDEFDVVAAEKSFERTFFDSLRSVANRPHLPLVLVVASVAPLKQIFNEGIYGSPFFNIFRQERLGLLSQEEAESLVQSPPGGGSGFGKSSEVLLRLAGRHPYFLQLACSRAWEMREASAGTLDAGKLYSEFARAARDQNQYIWDHSGVQERRAMCDLAQGARAAGDGLAPLIERGYVNEDDGLTLGGEDLTRFVKEQCATRSTNVLPAHQGLPSPRDVLPVMPTSGAAAPRFAIVVGVNRYSHARSGNLFLPELQYATKDALAVASMLRTLGFAVTELTDADATYDGVQQAFARLSSAIAAPGPDGCFVFHFSGHGLMVSRDDETAYLMVHDSDPAAPAHRGVEMRRLVYELLPSVRVAHSLVILDACHSGFAAGIKDIVPTSRLPNLTGRLFAALRGRMVLAACAGEAKARESDDFCHGVFTHYILKHWRDLEGEHPRDRITFGTLVDYVGRIMAEKHPDLPLPVYNGMGEGGMLILRDL